MNHVNPIAARRAAAAAATATDDAPTEAELTEAAAAGEPVDLAPLFDRIEQLEERADQDSRHIETLQAASLVQGEMVTRLAEKAELVTPEPDLDADDADDLDDLPAA